MAGSAHRDRRHGVVGGRSVDLTQHVRHIRAADHPDGHRRVPVERPGPVAAAHPHHCCPNGAAPVKMNEWS